MPQTTTGVIPDITLQYQASEDKGTDAKADTRGGSGVGARIGDAGPLSATIVWTCSMSPDTEQALRPQSPEVGTQAPGATCNMARRVCVPSLRSHRFQRFRIVSHKCSLWPTESWQIFRAGGFAECAEQNRPDPSQAGAVDISRTHKWVREPTDDYFIGNEQGRYIPLARCLCLVGLGGFLLVGICSLRL